MFETDQIILLRRANDLPRGVLISVLFQDNFQSLLHDLEVFAAGNHHFIVIKKIADTIFPTDVVGLVFVIEDTNVFAAIIDTNVCVEPLSYHDPENGITFLLRQPLGRKRLCFGELDYYSHRSYLSVAYRGLSHDGIQASINVTVFMQFPCQPS